MINKILVFMDLQKTFSKFQEAFILLGAFKVVPSTSEYLSRNLVWLDSPAQTSFGIRRL
jgi:hypothetical protein